MASDNLPFKTQYTLQQSTQINSRLKTKTFEFEI